jgi:F0F1-type ATP synthase epsilon subunit
MNIHLILRNAEQVVFEGEIKAITAENEAGIFDILPDHAHLITIVKNKIIIHHTTGTNEELKLDKGILKVEQNTIHIFLGVDLI